MITKAAKVEIEKLNNYIRLKKERIAKLHRLEKLQKNTDLLSEYDAIIKQTDDTINAVLGSKEIMDAHKEQVILRSSAKVGAMAKGLKASLCEAGNQIRFLNDSIETDNIRIHELEEGKTSTGGII